jgi:hypothetical protein
VEIVGAAFRNYLYLSAGISPVLRGISVRGDGYFLNRFFVGRDHSGAAPFQAVHTDAVQQIVVRGNALPIGYSLNLVLGLKYLAIGTPRADLLRNTLRVSIRCTRCVTENSWRQPYEVVGIATELR